MDTGFHDGYDEDVCADVLNNIITRIVVYSIKIENDDLIGTTPGISTYPHSESLVSIEKKNFRDEVISDSESLNDFYYSGDDSDEEFELLVSIPMNILKECHKKEYADELHKKKSRKTISTGDIEHEYTKMAAVVRPEVHLPKDAELKKLGFVANHIDCLLVIKSEEPIALDFDSYIFNKEKDLIGTVYDVLGSPHAPMYCIRFNCPDDALQYPTGMDVYIAPNDEVATKLVLVSQLSNLKITDASDNVEEDEFEFSDDEAEKRYRQNKSNSNTGEGRQDRKRHRGGGPRGRGNGNWNPTQREVNHEDQLPRDLESFFSGQNPNTMSAWPPRNNQRGRGGRGRGRWNGGSGNGNFEGHRNQRRGRGGNQNRYSGYDARGSQQPIVDSRYMGNTQQ